MSLAAINWNFAKAPGFIDPRASFVRATTATFIGPNGLIQTAPSGHARWGYDPVTLACRGYMCEPTRTNLMLWSQDADNAAWTKTNCTVTANSTTAPDGTATADTLTMTGASGFLIQGVTITAGRGVAFSCYMKANTSNFAFMSLNDGTNIVIVWFNLAAGTVGMQTGGSGTCLFSQALIEKLNNGWYRCSVEVTTATITSLGLSITACAADGVDGANGNSCYVWGVQAEAEAAVNAMTSYIPTTSATVTRNADNLTMPLSTSWFNNMGGALIIDVINNATHPTYSSISQPMYGGFGDNSFVNAIYISRIGNNQTLRANVLTGLGASANLDRAGVSWAMGGSNKIGLSWAQDNVRFLVNGGAAVQDSSQFLPVAANLVRMSVGGAPWGSISAATVGNCFFRSWQYYPAPLSTADLQALTAA